jgi:DNA-binding GntR family transcriptional regulator
MKMADDARPTTGVSGLPAVDRPPSLAEHVRRVLREDILTGRFASGEHLTEALVMERTNVSRTPVREGMRLLEAEGLVASERGRGAYVTAQLSREEAALMYRCRLLIEPFMTAAAVERMTPERLAQVDAALARWADALGRGISGPELGRIDAEFHDAIYKISGSPLLAVFRAYWSKLQAELSARVYSAEAPRHFHTEHREIFDALKRGDAEAASRAMSAHIEHGRRRLEKSFKREAEEG